MTEQSLVSIKSAYTAKLAAYTRDAEGALSDNTRKALASDTAIFTAWCADHGHEPLPAVPETVAAFIDANDDRAPASVRRYVSSIATLHRAAGLDTPTSSTEVRLALKRLARRNGTRQRQAAPLNRPVVEKMLEAAVAGDSLRGARDAALVAVAYDTLCRRSELAALDLADLTLHEDSTGTALIRRSKTDQAGEGSVRFLAADTVVLVKTWIDRAGITEGALFRGVDRAGGVGDRLSDRSVSRAFKRLAKLAGAPEAEISGHSCRVGGAQDMVAAGLELGEVMQAGGWRTPTMVARYSEKQIARRGAAAKLAALQNRL